MRVVASVPLNHPFMDTSSKDPRYADWSKKFADGKPTTTEHYGFAQYFEGCLNSPVRNVIRTLVGEVLTQYPVDVMYFDRPYMGMNSAKEYCPCKYCEGAYQERFGKPGPDDVEYTEWMANEVVEQRSGLMAQYVATRDTLLLHLIADTGNKTKKLRIREEFLPIGDVKVRVRVPDGRGVRAVSLMRAGAKVSALRVASG